ncbi:hypothetical protein BP5796_11035 [Coleophoma crateriformis]|uniref:Uncharacterized protein n=1 Tax=Coleophoma crateriformis TaxID=565419 RepID=A0A3D8QLN1_9HELO|nr:hypothetical protein BP5796_11035 [Coleophoma crateriformis]
MEEDSKMVHQKGTTREFRIWFKKDPQGLWQVCSRTACKKSKVVGSTWWKDCSRIDELAPEFQEAIDRFRDSRHQPIVTRPIRDHRSRSLELRRNTTTRSRSPRDLASDDWRLTKQIFKKSPKDVGEEQDKLPTQPTKLESNAN